MQVHSLCKIIVQDPCLSDDNPMYFDSVCVDVVDSSGERPGCRLASSPGLAVAVMIS